ncbi:MAG: hypothetical protein IJ184_00825 [Alphaproteobacteria bacterium]|nr:hypothetical protein [Alphaproteobacteria bacterium]
MIYCDMDGVLVDFDRGFMTAFNCLPDDLPRQQMWERVVNTSDYWVNLPPKDDAFELTDYLANLSFEILTGLPHHGFDKANIEKRRWIKKHLGADIKVNCCLSKEKQNFLKSGDILIDDYPPNIERWESAGGIGILHTSAAATIRRLQELGF